MTPTNMAKTNIQRMDGPSSKFGSTGGIVNRSLLTPMSKSALPPQELGSVAQYQLHEARSAKAAWALCSGLKDTFLKRSVALKVMRPDIAKDEQAWKRFLIEGQATAALKNDRIATIYQIGEDKGKFYLAMELLHGEPLESRLRRGPMPLRQILGGAPGRSGARGGA